MVSDADDTEPCPACGAPGGGGLAGCQAVFDALTLRGYGDLDYAAPRDLALDSYCMQHLERYCASAKSYAAHLARLCCGLEHGGDPAIYRAIQGWLSGPRQLAKPAAPSTLGALTVADCAAATDGAAYRAAVQAWAENVWAAYAAQHDLARSWVAAARAAPTAKH